MNTKKVVRVSAVALFATAAIGTSLLLDSKEAKAQGNGGRYLASDWACYSGGGCLPTLVVKPEER